MCTFENCLSSTHLFESRREWAQHEAEIHGQHYCCQLCRIDFQSRRIFEQHWHSAHPEIPLLESVLFQSKRATAPADQICKLCGISCSPKSMVVHVGAHLQSIAVFALPRALYPPDVHNTVPVPPRSTNILTEKTSFDGSDTSESSLSIDGARSEAA